MKIKLYILYTIIIITAFYISVSLTSADYLTTLANVSIQQPIILCYNQVNLINITAYDINQNPLTDINSFQLISQDLTNNNISYSVQAATITPQNTYQIPLTITNLSIIPTTPVYYNMTINTIQSPITNITQNIIVEVESCKVPITFQNTSDSISLWVQHNWLILVIIFVVFVVIILIAILLSLNK